MAHHLSHGAYSRLATRLDRHPQGAPPSPLLNRILQILVDEHEADLLAQLPIRPLTVERAARVWGVRPAQARHELDTLASRAMLVDFTVEGRRFYALPPPMAGFFEFSLMRVREDMDQKALSELFYAYLNQEEDFVRELFTTGETRLGRVFVDERALPMDHLVVLDHERASLVLQTASDIAVGTCYCRHKMRHVGRACSAPLDVCMTLNVTASALIRHGHARRVDVVEGLELLAMARAQGLVQFGENVREGVNFICHCCGCCCEGLQAAKRFAMLHPVQTTHYLPRVAVQVCRGCGLCASACPVDGMEMVTGLPDRPEQVARVDEDRCLGCGLCVAACPHAAITLERHEPRRLTPLNGAHRTVLMAIERGKLPALIFDNHLLWSHRALAALLGVILRLPPVARLLATEQVRSRYLEAICRRTVWK